VNNCNIPENLANRYGLATIGYIYDVNGTDVFNELNDYIKFHNIDYNTDDMFSVYNPSIFMPQYYNKYGYWMMLFKLEHEIPLTSFEKTIYNVKFDNNIDTLRDDYINKRVYSDPTFNSNVKKDENVNILYRKIENKVYGFITPDNIIYLDKDSLNNPNTMFHEFYHLYDKILVNNSDESTQAYSIITRANELIVESGHLNEVQNDINYKHLSLELQQIEARARMIGDYAENKFNNNKISKLVNDIIEYIKSLFDKGTFDDYSNDEILKMNIVDFNDIVINEMINNDESIVSKDLNKVLLNKLKSVFKPYYKEVTFDKNKANSIRKEYEKRADIIYLNQIILDNITNNEYNIVEGSNWNLPYDNKLILDLLNSDNMDAINVITKLIVGDNPQLLDVNIGNVDLIKYVAHNLTIDDVELLLSLDLNDKEFNDFITERNKKRIYNNTKHFYISVANNYNKYLEYNKLRNDETFKELYDNIDNNSILTPENSLYLYSIFNKEFKNKKEITQELNKYNIYKNYANSIQAMFIKEIEKNPNLDLNEVANNLFDNNNIKILNDNVNYFESRYPIWTNYVDIIPSTNIKLTNSTLNDILSVYTGELYFNDLLNYKGNISFNLTNILNKRIIDLFETDEMENDYIKNNVVSLVGNEIMNNAKFRNDIQSLFNKSMNKNISYGINFGVNGEYYKGLQNVRDFVTESLTNERFISYLKSLNVLEDVYNRIDFYTNINTQTNNLERNKEILQEKYQELIKLDMLLRNINEDTIVELSDNNLIIDDNIINLTDVGYRLTDENSDNIVDVLNKFSSKILKEFSEFDVVNNDTTQSQQSLDNLTVEEIEANRNKELEEFVLNIFPETVVKQVVYHGSEEKRDFYKGDVIFFSSDKDWTSNFGQVVQSSVINLKNPFDAAGLTVAYDDENGQFGFLDPRTIKKEGLEDGIWGGFDLGQREGYQFTVFDPNQVHILTQEELNKIDEINAKYDKMLEDLNNSNEEILDKDKIDYQKDDKELVDMSYELFPELENIGSKDLFQQYLKNAFEKDKDNNLKNIYSKYTTLQTISKLSGFDFKNEEWLNDKNMVYLVENYIKGIPFLEDLYEKIKNNIQIRNSIKSYAANTAENVLLFLRSHDKKFKISNQIKHIELYEEILKLYVTPVLNLYRTIEETISKSYLIPFPVLNKLRRISNEDNELIGTEALDIIKESLLNIPNEFDNKTAYSGVSRVSNIIRKKESISDLFNAYKYNLNLFHKSIMNERYDTVFKFSDIKYNNLNYTAKRVMEPSIKNIIEEFKEYSNNNVEQKGNIKPTSISILNEMADDFQSRYNITFKVIRESEAMKLLDKNNVPNAFYYEPTNTAYIVEGKANEISVVHELGHAFLYKIKNDNIKLYNNLVEEARNMPEITDYVNRVYGQISKDKYEQEVIMRAIDLYNQDKLDAKENKGLIDLITEFLLSISSYIKDLLGFERIDVNIIEPDTKLKDIADLLYLYKGNMDLSTKNKTQNFTYDERQNIRNIVNGNESEGIGNIAESARNYIVRSNKTIGGGSNNIGREKELLEEFLKENPQFIYDIDENPLGTQVAAGAQSKVYMSEDDTKYVYKKSWLTAHGGILENLTSILLHNMLFNNVEYEILGFYISDDFEKYNIILKQRFVLKEQMYNYDSIVEYLTHNHFIEKNGVFNNFDLKIKVTDLHPGNVYFANNKIFFIDPIVTTIPNSRDIHLGKVLEQLPEQNEDKSITVDDFYNKYQDKVINMLDIKKIENFNKDKGYAAINVIKRNDGKYVAIKNSEKVIQSDNNFIPTYQGLLSGNNPVKFYKTGNNYNINSLSNNTFYINEPVEIDEKGNAIIQDYNNIIPTNEIKTIINERFKDNNDYYLNNLLKDIKLSNYLTSEEADRYAEFIKNVNINRNQKYIIDIVDNKGFKELDIIADDNNIIDINSNFSPTTIRAIEDKGLNIEEMNNPLLLSLQSLITNGELSEELTCKI
jgi:hypothetical protein